MTDSSTVGIVLAVHNGAAYLEEQVESIRAQTHEKWRLWIRDDGSTDDTAELVDRLAARDERVSRVHDNSQRLGAGPSFGTLLQGLPRGIEYVFCCDADDVWFTDKIERSLDTMREAEMEGGGPLLVHSDLRVADSALALIHTSYWELIGINPNNTSFPGLFVHNVATGPTMMMNRDLFERVTPIPQEAANHDWWITLVAAAVGRIVAIPEPTVTYRRHDSNTTAELTGPIQSIGAGLQRLGRFKESTHAMRRWIEASALQTQVFLPRFGDRLAPDVVRAAQEIATIPNANLLGRKRLLLRYFTSKNLGLLRSLSILVRG
ncbi:MAG: glycosyltransferase family 2 protein [Gemmatimonadales bacterium]|nr:glycosyltransferase family 2 protein [Gemmatimonadales bacterium]MBT3957832.1 glycosyltransferase family 2 protein [Gemmatimonadales bacterium]MBT5044762.1 glycosyltransferase family 2 protein [Gemmatimonadales bacterium]MBT5697071.1 glycosyltransferase family 2 protein [Gemmatimonadales bacterium]